MKSQAFNSFVDRLSRQNPDEVLEMRASVQSMLDSPGWGHVSGLLESRAEAVAQLMATGIHEQAEYAAMVAEIRGLQSVTDAADAVLEAANRAEQALTELAAGLAAGEPA